MVEGKINAEVLRALRENTKGNDLIFNFIEDLLITEREHEGRWQFKKDYEKKIKEYAQQWRKKYED